MTTATIKKPTIAAFRRMVSAELRARVAEMHARRVFAAAERERVDAYVAPIFAEYRFVDVRTGRRIAEPKDLYRVEDMAEPAVVEYSDRVLAANVANGWTGDPQFCPALCAETDATKAEWAVIGCVARFMGFNPRMVYGDKRAQLLKLAIDACNARE